MRTWLKKTIQIVSIFWIFIIWKKIFSRMPGKFSRTMKASTAHGQKTSARWSEKVVLMKFLRYWQHCLQFQIEIASICHITWPHIETISTTPPPSISQRDISLEAAPLRAAIKIVLQKRLKLAGMRWNVPTAQCMLTIRARVESGLWDEVVDLTMRHYALQITECAAA